MTVYIGIVSYNSLADLPACIAAIRAQTHLDLQISALDNASSDGSADWIRVHVPEARLIQIAENVGFGVGHNTLLKNLNLSPNDFYLTCNPDLIMQQDYVADLVNALQASGAGWGVGKLVLPPIEGQITRLYSVGHALRRDGYVLNIGMGLPDEGQFEQMREVFGAPGCAALYSGRLIQALAPEGDLFDPDFFLYGEDTDLDWRARRQGWRCIYVPGAVGSHRGSQPGAKFQVMALGNRYLSVIKSAYALDLLTYNLPLMGLHLLARCIFTPSLGFSLLSRIIRDARRFWGKRTRPVLSRREMMAWFRWADQQSTTQARTLNQRWDVFVGNRGSADNRPNAPPKQTPPPYVG